MTHSGYYETYWKQTPGSAWTPSSGKITEDEREFFSRYLSPGASCLDYGCGNAKRYGASLAADGVDYRGFDISEQLRHKRCRSPEGRSIKRRGENQLPDATMDAAICFEVLEHLMEPQLALAELQRCLKPGGHAILSVPNSAHYLQRPSFFSLVFGAGWKPSYCPQGALVRSAHPFFQSTDAAPFAGANGVGDRGAARRAVLLLLAAHRVAYREPASHLRISLHAVWMAGKSFPRPFARRLFIQPAKPSAE